MVVPVPERIASTGGSRAPAGGCRHVTRHTAPRLAIFLSTDVDRAHLSTFFSPGFCFALASAHLAEDRSVRASRETARTWPGEHPNMARIRLKLPSNIP